MIKPSHKKLAPASHTVRRLDPEQLAQAGGAGGIILQNVQNVVIRIVAVNIQPALLPPGPC